MRYGFSRMARTTSVKTCIVVSTPCGVGYGGGF
jgi:hypothetical protein